jgi:predicted DNA-binding protein (MmcQ/YjbR family)
MAPATPKTAAARERILARLRKICLALPEATEKASFGNPAFRAGARPFVVLDRYQGTDCIFFYVEPGRRDELLKSPTFFKAPYDPREQGLCRTLEKIDWREMRALIVGSYRRVANKRMLAALDRSAG